MRVFCIIFFCAYIIMNVVSNAIQLFYSIETKTVEQKIFHWSRKPGSHRDRNTTETNLSLPPPTPQSYQTSMATKSSLAFVKTFISRANERATSSRTATKPGSFQKRNEGNTRAEFESVPLHTYNHRAPGSYLPRQTARSITERKEKLEGRSRLFTPLSATNRLRKVKEREREMVEGCAWCVFKYTVCPPLSGAPLFLIFSAGGGVAERGSSGSLAHFLGMLPPKVRFPCSLVSLSSSRTRGTGSLSLWATRARSATCPCVWKEQRCLPTCSTCIALRPLSLVPASTLLVFVLFASPPPLPRRLSAVLSFFFFFLFLFFSPSNASEFLVSSWGRFCALSRFRWRRSVRWRSELLSELVGRSVGWPGSGTMGQQSWDSILISERFYLSVRDFVYTNFTNFTVEWEFRFDRFLRTFGFDFLSLFFSSLFPMFQ